DAFKHRMTGEQLRNLERTSNSTPRDSARRQLGDRLAFESDATGRRVDIAGAEIEKCRLTRPVRTDDRDELVGIYVEFDPVRGHDAAEGDPQIADCEDRVHFGFVLRRSSRWISP